MNLPAPCGSNAAPASGPAARNASRTSAPTSKAEVRDAFLAAGPEAGAAFEPHGAGKFMADLYALARLRLARAGVREVHCGGFCTYRERGRFFSYRRVPASGRMGAFIWME